MKAWLLLFLSPDGAIGRRTFQHGIVVIAFANVLPTFGCGFLLHRFIVWPMLATLWPTICVTTKRLHTHGASGWIQAPQRMVIAAALLASLARPDLLAHNPWVLVATAIVVPAALLADAVMFLFLALSPRQPADLVGEIFG